MDKLSEDRHNLDTKLIPNYYEMSDSVRENTLDDSLCGNSINDSSMYILQSAFQNLAISNLKPIVVPTFTVKEKEPLSLNFTRLLMTHNTLLRLVLEKNHEINFHNARKKFCEEKKPEGVDGNYYSISSNYLEEFDTTELDP